VTLRRLLVLLVAGALSAIAATTVVPAAALAAAASPADPPWSVPEASLAAGLVCPTAFTHPEHEPVLLVHGTFTSGPEQYGWNYELLLPERGFDVCVVTYPDRGLGDLQVSAEYVAHAILEVHRRTGSRVDVMGHSQGGLLPRWAIKFWPSVAAVVDDAVLVAPPSHGTDVASLGGGGGIDMPAAFFQMASRSRFVNALNAGDETPGDVSWSVLYTELDELVQPVAPVPTAPLDWQHEPANVRNVLIQDVCPGRIVDHLSIGTTDRLSQELVLDALAGPGPVDPARLGPASALCALPDQYVSAGQVPALLSQLTNSLQSGMFDFHATSAEPPLKPYAAEASAPGPAPAAEPSDSASTATMRASTGTPASPGARTLPATGSSVPLPLAVLIGLAGLAAIKLVRARPSGA
jgi:hypothetical protein